VVSLATAAAVLLAVYLPGWLAPKPAEPGGPGPAAVATAPPRAGWGWDRPDALPADALPADVPPADYLNRLADAAEEWFKKRPEDAPALARRLNEFRQGCSTLILAQHKPLADMDRPWLAERCRAWATKLDKALSDVESGRDVAQVRAEADETARHIAGRCARGRRACERTGPDAWWHVRATTALWTGTTSTPQRHHPDGVARLVREPGAVRGDGEAQAVCVVELFQLR
jgi:hypothetical protein